MKISTRAHYGLRAMTTLAALEREGRCPLSVVDIAKVEDLPENYLEQLIGGLRRAGLLRSYRGAKGGYELARPAKEISVLEILRASGERLEFPECTSGGCDRAKARAAECDCARFWRSMNNRVLGFAAKVTLQDLIDGGPEESGTGA